MNDRFTRNQIVLLVEDHIRAAVKYIDRNIDRIINIKRLTTDEAQSEIIQPEVELLGLYLIELYNRLVGETQEVEDAVRAEINPGTKIKGNSLDEILQDYGIRRLKSGEIPKPDAKTIAEAYTNVVFSEYLKA